MLMSKGQIQELDVFILPNPPNYYSFDHIEINAAVTEMEEWFSQHIPIIQQQIEGNILELLQKVNSFLAEFHPYANAPQRIEERNSDLIRYYSKFSQNGAALTRFSEVISSLITHFTRSESTPLVQDSVKNSHNHSATNHLNKLKILMNRVCKINAIYHNRLSQIKSQLIVLGSKMESFPERNDSL